MNTKDKTLGILGIKERKEEFLKSYRKYEEKQKEINDKSRDLVSNEDYISWLSKFMEDYPVFTSSDWIDVMELLGSEDRSGVMDLHLFYKGISLYAKENYIYPESSEGFEYYSIKYKDFGYRIAEFGDMRKYWACERISLDEEEDFIDFYDIMANKENPQKKDNDERLKILEDLIVSIIGEGTGRAMLNKSLIQFSVDGWSCVPFVISVHFTLVAHRVKLFATPGIAARQASLSITNSRGSPKLMSIELVMPSSHLILCHSLLLLPPIPSSIRVFSNESTLCMRWPKYLTFTFTITLSKKHPGLISFRMDWLDLLAVQGTLKNLLQHHSSRASISSALRFHHSPTLTSIHDHWKNHSLD